MYFWAMVICMLLLFMTTYCVRCEFFDTSAIDLDSASTGQKYSFNDVKNILNTWLSQLEDPSSVIRVSTIKRKGATIKMRAFVQNNKTNAVFQYEIVGKIPMRTNGQYIVEDSKVVHAEVNDVVGGDINTGMYARQYKDKIV